MFNYDYLMQVDTPSTKGKRDARIQSVERATLKKGCYIYRRSTRIRLE